MEQNRKLTKEEVNILAKYTKQFEMVKKGYLRGVSITASKEISQIVDGKEKHYNWNCSACMINLWTNAANLYKYNLQEASNLKKTNNTELQNEKPKRRTSKKKQEPQVESEA